VPLSDALSASEALPDISNNGMVEKYRKADAELKPSSLVLAANLLHQSKWPLSNVIGYKTSELLNWQL